MADEFKNTGSSRADRPLSFKGADYGVPQGTEEDWRFTPLERVEDFFADSFAGTGLTVSAHGGVELVEVGRDDPRLGSTIPPEDRVGATTWESFDKAYVLSIPKDEKVADEVIVTLNGSGGSGVVPAHLYVEAQRHSEATVILDHVGGGKLAEGVEINLEDGAHLTLVTLQDWDEKAVHASSHRIKVGRDATLKHIVVSLGGDLIRITSSVDFAGPGGDVTMLGAYFVDEYQHMEHRLFVDHNVPNAKSNVAYKGALQGTEAHSVWVGDVLIGKDAIGTDTYELNRNLILTEGASADSVPNLEIETGEIEGAGHASATGRFDDEQLFYLMARGIPEDEARRLVVRGFFAELINQIGVESVQNKLMEKIEEELNLTGEL
ncbi:Fe-S cluster assembly protein SufD [Arcanobacterium wilhelmae]|uniref:Fe-S cluster assembly protein SufD n=1 Tax=Arcanobacterium wilhelmae TaxID=1803177 RepID=A0ABT9N8B7_9ACTO|nr:Fe-S cluster assembly protein SufD [Arcanobacterium wilhelmae]MDP9799940.1 Fe-S cluster assembly protein SufD [Arcanobacterium wilhelmae]WFN91075.1 Fe-S cluster assembly protein SufD [Arcanobacterium wilhelmae]